MKTSPSAVLGAARKSVVKVSGTAIAKSKSAVVIGKKSAKTAITKSGGKAKKAIGAAWKAGFKGKDKIVKAIKAGAKVMPNAAKKVANLRKKHPKVTKAKAVETATDVIVETSKDVNAETAKDVIAKNPLLKKEAKKALMEKKTAK